MILILCLSSFFENCFRFCLNFNVMAVINIKVSNNMHFNAHVEMFSSGVWGETCSHLYPIISCAMGGCNYGIACLVHASIVGRAFPIQPDIMEILLMHPNPSKLGHHWVSWWLETHQTYPMFYQQCLASHIGTQRGCVGNCCATSKGECSDNSVSMVAPWRKTKATQLMNDMCTHHGQNMSIHYVLALGLQFTLLSLVSCAVWILV